MERCKRKKCGEYNMLRCALEERHGGDCCFVVDGAERKSARRRLAVEAAAQARTTLAKKP